MNVSSADLPLPHLQALAEAAARAGGCELVECAVRGAGPRPRLEVTIDRPGGVSVEDCARVSRSLAAAIDQAAPGPDYLLEVSSPGLTRKLERAEDFTRFRGRLALLQLRQPLAGKQRLRGTLEGLGDGGAIRIREGESGPVVEVAASAVAWARLDYDPAPAPPPGAKRRRPS